MKDIFTIISIVVLIIVLVVGILPFNEKRLVMA